MLPPTKFLAAHTTILAQHWASRPLPTHLGPPSRSPAGPARPPDPHHHSVLADETGSVVHRLIQRPSAGSSLPSTPCPIASSPRSPTSQREEPSSSCQPNTVRGLALGLPHPPARMAATRGHGQTLAQGGAGALAKQVAPPFLLLYASTHPTPMVAAKTRGLEGGFAPGSQESVIITSGHWTLVLRPMMVPPQQAQPQASCS